MHGHAVGLAVVLFCSLSITLGQDFPILIEVQSDLKNVTYPSLDVNETSPDARNESDGEVSLETTSHPVYLVPLDTVSLEALRDAVTRRLRALVYEGLVKTNASLVDKAENFSSCLQTIHQIKDECFACINDLCQFRADECTDVGGENPEIESAEPEPKIDLTEKLKCVVSPSLCVVERLDKKVEKEINRAGNNIAKGVKNAGEVFGDAFKRIGDTAEDIAKDLGKGLEKAGKAIGGAAEDLSDGLEDAGKAIGGAVEDAVKAVGHGLDKTAKAAEDAVKHAGRELENIGKNIGRELENTKNAAENIMKGIGDGLKDVGKTVEHAAKHAIVNPVKDVLKGVGRIIPPVRIRLPKVHLPRIHVPRIRIRLPRISRGWRRRRRSSEPTCEELSDDSASSCRFYQTRCDVCSPFGQPDSEQSIDDMLEEFCGEGILVTYQDLNILANRLSTLIDLYDVEDVFVLESLSFDPISYKGEGYTTVNVTFLSLNQTSSFYLQRPTLPHAAEIAGPIIAEEIYQQLIS